MGFLTTPLKKNNLVASLFSPASPRTWTLSLLSSFVFFWTSLIQLHPHFKTIVGTLFFVLCVGCGLCYLFPVPTSGHLANYCHFLSQFIPPYQIISVPSFSNYFDSSPSILTSELLIFILVHWIQHTQIKSELRFQSCITTCFIITFVNNSHPLQLFEHHLSLPLCIILTPLISFNFQKTTLWQLSV